MSQAFFISGRSLRNWREKGKTPPADAVTVACLSCNEYVTISVEGWAKLCDARGRGDSPAGALCTTCVAVIAAQDGPRLNIMATKAGAELMEHDKTAKELLDFMVDKGAKL